MSDVVVERRVVDGSGAGGNTGAIAWHLPACPCIRLVKVLWPKPMRTLLQHVHLLVLFDHKAPVSTVAGRSAINELATESYCVSGSVGRLIHAFITGLSMQASFACLASLENAMGKYNGATARIERRCPGISCSENDDAQQDNGGCSGRAAGRRPAAIDQGGRGRQAGQLHTVQVCSPHQKPAFPEQDLCNPARLK